MSSAGSPRSYHNNLETRQAIHQLQELLDILHPDPTPDILTLNSLEYRYKLHDKNDGLNVAALRGIEQAQRINRDLGEYKQSGLNEFHIGIIYLYWGECHAAEKGFDLAWRHWSMGHEQLADLALSLFGRGWAQEIFRHEEAAMISYAKARRYLRRMPVMAGPQMNFQETLERFLWERQEKLREKMHHQPTEDNTAEEELTPPEVEGGDEPATAVPEETDEAAPSHAETDQTDGPEPPRTNLSDDPMPIDGHVKVDGSYRWYLVEQRQADSYLPQIHSQDWLLVFMQPDQSDLAQTEERPIVIVCQSGSSSTIHLRPHPSEKVTQGHRIYLREQRDENWSFVRNADTGEVFLTPEGRRDVVDLEKIIGIVVGLWRPSTHWEQAVE